jgi:hypothetical protein
MKGRTIKERPGKYFVGFQRPAEQASGRKRRRVVADERLKEVE